MTKYKQVIIIRKDLKMRKGKMVAQGAHASIGSLSKASENKMVVDEWNATGSTKICVGVESIGELLSLFADAKTVNLPCYLVKDEGRTEFKEPTITAIAIGPADVEMIDAITGKLSLL